MTHSRSNPVPEGGIDRAAPILVLGGSGFIGRAVVRALSAIRTVLAPRSSELDLTLSGPLRSYAEKLPESTRVLFLSAATPDRGISADLYDRNLAMAESVATLLRLRPDLPLIYLSSASVYGRGKTCMNVREDSPIVLDSDYARSKFDSEVLLSKAGARVTILRTCHVYGPGDTHPGYDPARSLLSAKAGQPITIYGEGDDLRDHLYIGDAARIIADFADRPSAGIFNLATGTSRSFRDIATILRSLLTPTPPLAHVARTAPLFHQGFDIGKLGCRLPGFVFTPLEQGIALMIAG
jgi:UDP-glucose 4-epimerase